MKRSSEIRLLVILTTIASFCALAIFLIQVHPIAKLTVALITASLSMRLFYIRLQRKKEHMALKNELIDELYKLRN